MSEQQPIQQPLPQPAAPMPQQPQAAPYPGANYIPPAGPAPSAPYYAPRPYSPPPPTPGQLYRRGLNAKMVNKRGLTIALFAFAFAYFYSEAVVSHGTWGIGMTLVVLAYCTFSFVMFYIKSENKNPRALILYIPILAIAAGFALHYNPMSHAPMFLTLLTLLILQLIMLTSPDIKEAFSPRMAGLVFTRTIGKPIQFLFSPFRTLGAAKQFKSKSLKTALLVLAGVAVAVPACALLLMWFTRADVAFADGFTRFSDWLAKIITPQWGRIVLNLFMALLLGLPLGAVLLFNASEKAPAEAKDKTQKGAIGAVPVAAFLSAVALVMLLFVGAQFAYFFFGASNGAVESIGYSEYARRGFFELSYASTFVFALAALVLALTRRNEAGKVPVYVRGALIAICLCNLVILVSALLRMQLYIEIHGFSIKRLMTLWLMPVMGVCTLLLIAKCLFEKFKSIKAIGTAVVVAVCLLAVFNTDRFVAERRVDRYLESGVAQDLDAAYFRQLSYSALPALDRLEAAGNPDELLPLRRASNIRKGAYNQLETQLRYSDFYGFTFDRLSLSYENITVEKGK